MIYVIILIGVIALLYYYFIIHGKKKLLNKMETGVGIIRLGTYARLKQKYKDMYGEEKARFLAAAVTNELFSEHPSNPEGEEFLKANKALIERELSNVKNDEEICNAVTQAVRVQVIVDCERGIRSKESLLDSLDKITKLGVLVPGGVTPSPKTFLLMANEFYQSINGSSRSGATGS